jgi:hypothetical protein
MIQYHLASENFVVDMINNALEGTEVSLNEPRKGDIPKVFIDGIIPTTKDDVFAEMTYMSKSQ